MMCLFPPSTLANRVNLDKCMRMGLTHDLAESLVGDITPADNIPKSEKFRREGLTMDYIQELLGGEMKQEAQHLLAVWKEFEEGATLDSLFVQDVDKIELLLQMTEYEKRHQIDLSEFTYVANKIRLEEMKPWAAQILRQRASPSQLPPNATVDQETLESLKPAQDRYYSS